MWLMTSLLDEGLVEQSEDTGHACLYIDPLVYIAKEKKTRLSVSNSPGLYPKLRIESNFPSEIPGFCELGDDCTGHSPSCT